MAPREPSAGGEASSRSFKLAVYLVRHGQAGPAAEDSERLLTEKGKADVGRAAERLAGVKPAPEAVLASPLKRAGQTAKIIADRIGCPGIDVMPALAPGTNLDRLLSLLRENTSRNGVCLVGHMPELGELAGFLAARKRGHLIELAAGALVCAEFVRRGGREDSSLEWILNPGDTG